MRSTPPRMTSDERAEKARFLRSSDWRVEPGDPLCHCTRQDRADTYFYPQGWMVTNVCMNCRRKVA